MGVYVGTVLLALILLFAVYFGIVFAVEKQKPLEFVKLVRDVLLLTL